MHFADGRLLILLVAILGSVEAAKAADFQVDEIQRLPGRADVRFAKEPGSYYILWRGHQPTDIHLATDLALGTVPGGGLSDTNGTNAAQFYRVEQVPLTSLRDTDGDGIYDAWELLHRHPGAALNPNDAEEDHNNNGVPDRIDALRESLREGGVRGRPALAAGTYHSLALKIDGTLWGWGDNIAGELGATGFTETNVPVQIGPETNWVAVSGNSLASFGLKADGTLWAWGQSNPPVVIPATQLGTNSDWISLPKQPLYLGPTALRADGTRWQFSGTGTNLQQMGSDTDWAASFDGPGSAGHWAIKRDGTLWSGVTLFDTNLVWGAISVGLYHALALRTDGTLWAWVAGCCQPAVEGQLGLGSAQPYTPTQVGSDTWAAVSAGWYHSVGIKSDGSLWWWGANLGFTPSGEGLVRTNLPTRIGTNTDWLAVSAGDSHTVALRQDGTIWTFGANELGKLGNGTVPMLARPTRVGADQDWAEVATGSSSSFGLKTNGTLWAWGLNSYGLLGVGDFASGFVPRPVPGSNWVAISGGGDFSAALKSDGGLWVWGKHQRHSSNPTLDIFTNQPTQLGTNTDWLRISAGGRHALAVRQDSTLWAWGRGALGNGTFSDTQNQPIQIQTPSFGNLGWSNISAGHQSSLGNRFPGSTLWAWGTPIGSFGSISEPQDQPAAGTGWAATALAKSHSFSSHALGRKRNGTLWAWGSGSSGQLGGAGTTSNPAQVGTGTNWSTISIGDLFSGAMQNDGTLWMTGFNFYGQLGFGLRSQSTNQFTRVGSDTNWLNFSAGFRHVLAVKTDGTLWAWGDNSYGQCGQLALYEPVAVAGTNWGKPH